MHSGNPQNYHKRIHSYSIEEGECAQDCFKGLNMVGN